MLKPLLRTIPNMSGNVKLACSLSDYTRKTDTNIYVCNVRGARLLPLASSLKQYNIKANLLGSTWDYDLKTYYEGYSDVFFSDCFNYSKETMGVLDETASQYFRNTDFEFGVKRVSYIKNDAQYAFFAPIYVESEDDIPDCFDITINFTNRFYNFSKVIRINIGEKNSKNYLYNYLHEYCRTIDNNVAYMNQSAGSIVYDGIDLVNGGLVSKSDVTVKNIYKVQLPMQKLDDVITSGFKRNRMCIKQVIPLCFYIDIDRLFDDDEKYRKFMKYCTVAFSGKYYIGGNEAGVYDFSCDYDEFSQNILKMDTTMGFVHKIPGKVSNIMDTAFPAMYEDRLLNYQFTNKLGADITRWKLKYSSDSYPYITNLSWAYSINQDSNYLYREFPTASSPVQGVCIETKIFSPVQKDYEYVYNLIYPLEYHNDMKVYWYSSLGRKNLNKDIYDEDTYNNYASFINNYTANWFDITRTDITKGSNKVVADHWEDVDADGKVYYNGILYNLNNVYNASNKNKITKIDKFGVFAYVNTDNIGVVTTKDYVFSDYGFISYNTTFVETENTNIYDNIVNSTGYIGQTSLFTRSDEYYADTVEYNTIYKNVGYIDTDTLALKFTETNADQTDLDIEVGYVTGLDYYELNNYYSYRETHGIIDDIRKRMEEYDGTDTEIKEAFISEFNNRGHDSDYLDAYLDVLGEVASVVFADDVFVISYMEGDIYIPSTITAPLAYNGEEIQSYIVSFNKTYLTSQVSSGVYKYNNEGYYLSKNIYNNDDDGDVILSCNVQVEDITDTMDQNEYAGLKWELHSTDETGYNQFRNNIYMHDSFIDKNDINALSSDDYPVMSSMVKTNTARMVLSVFKRVFFDNAVGCNEYEYHQDLFNNDTAGSTTIGEKCYTMRGYLGRKYENNTNIANMEKDRDVLYIRSYNVYNLIDEYNKRHTEQISKDNHRKEKFYSVALNKSYLWSWYAELYKNETKSQTGPNASWKDQLFIQKKVLVHMPGGNVAVKYQYIPITNFFNIETFEELMSYIRYDYYRKAFTFNTVSGRLEFELLGDVTYGMKYSYLGIATYGLEFEPLELAIPDDVLASMVNRDEFEYDYFNICILEDYMRLDSDIWKIMNTPDVMDGTKKSVSEPFIDMYVHRPYRPYEYDTKFYKPIVINSNVYPPMHGTMDYIGLYTDYRTAGGEIYDDVIGYSKIEDIENCLTPMFNSIFMEEEKSTGIWECVHFDETTRQTYKDYIKGDEVTNYRYNSNNMVMMIKLDMFSKDLNDDIVNIRNLCAYVKSQREKGVNLPDVKLYNKWSGGEITTILGKQTDEDMMNYNENTKIHVFKGDDGLMYGYYYINVGLDNTYNTFNVVGLDQNSLFTSVDDEYHSFKILKYINYTNIEENKEYLVDNFKRILPFINTNIMNVFSEISSIYKPSTYKLETYYYPKKDENEYNRTIVHLNNEYSNQKVLLQRYLDSIVPYITKCDDINGLYFRKMKDVNEKLLETGRYNITGDSPIYKETSCNIYEFPGHNIYTNYDSSKSIHDELDASKNTKYSKSYNIVYDDKYRPLEYKYYNDSRYIYLPVEISISLPSSYTYDEILDIEQSDDTIVRFGKELNRNYTFDTDEILFLYNKYGVTFDTNCIGLDLKKENKLYTVTYKYKLL